MAAPKTTTNEYFLTMTSAPILKLDGINLHLKSAGGNVHVLKDISLDLPAGKTISVVGPSGSGKTTLLMILSGLEKPTTGTVNVAGQQLNDLSEDALATFRRDNVGIVFQNFHLIPTMSALENVAIPLELAGHKDAFDRARAALEAVGLKDRVTHYPSQLSGGEQQRVAIARAFAPGPKLILADEPTGNLDADTGKKVMDILFRFTHQNNATFILVTHDLALAAQCDMTLHISDGRIG